MKRAVAFALFSVVIGACRAPPPPPAPPSDPMPDALAWPGPALQHTRTPSGLMVAAHDPGPDQPSFSLTLVLPFGSVNDPKGQAGAAFTAAVLFGHAGIREDLPIVGGTPPPPHRGEALGVWLQARGVDRHAEAYPESLVFSLHGPAPLAGEMTRVLCQLVFDPRVDAKGYQDAVDEVAQADEDRTAGNATLAQEALTHALFPGHALGRPAVPAGQEVPDLEALLEFQRSVTSEPSRTLLLAATTDATGVLRAAADCTPPRTTRPPPSPPPPADAPPEPRRLGLSSSAEGTVFIRYGGRAPPPGTPELAALQAALETLANGFSSTLVTRLRTRRGLVYGVEGAVLSTRSAATWYVGTSTSSANAPEVLRILESAFADIRDHGLPPDDFRRMARANALGFAQGTDSLEGLMSTEAEHFRLGRPPGASWGTPRLWWEMDPAWGAHTAARWLDPAHNVLVVVAGEEALAGPLQGVVTEMIDVEDWPPR